LITEDAFQVAYDGGARIITNSWGIAPPFNYYGGQSVDIDDFVYTHDDVLVLVAAGNQGQEPSDYDDDDDDDNDDDDDDNDDDDNVDDDNDDDGGDDDDNDDNDIYSYSYSYDDEDEEDDDDNGDDEDEEDDNDNGDDDDDDDYFRSASGGDASIGSPAVSKNVLTVGAAETGKASPSTVAYFSSRGPTRDMRLKPEVCGPGMMVYAAEASGFAGKATCSVTRKAGTSMATPAVAGVAAMIR